ncbi:phage tail tape measure protein [Photobacterium sp. TY1-4]|uniref:phage tail tape measure protein n=1 Tax=Photobacterium sp. TY1-4 TaxID=2899122 RepID=UPI0021C08087|nr:phage tail tape measure protein [Photobacterium sp. TY1-4]UXI00427.1 phage tail tape measure protein [Photobacterium sp. TY1-4]
MLPDALKFQVGLVDQISKPLGNIKRQLNDVTQTYRAGAHSMAAGAVGVAGAGFALQQALMPAIEMDRALGEVKALGVADEGLRELTKTALNFSAQYGQSAVDVIAHAEGVKNAMGDMPGAVLASVTNSSATLAMAMKSDAETVNRYMKNLYGNYQKQADAMGKDAWAAQIAGMTAEMKRVYGVGMDALEGMIDGQHSLASSMGMSVHEQLATFGFLSQYMSEGDANTQLTNFLEGMHGAQEKLGIQFTDTAGEMLPMQQILDNVVHLFNRFGDAKAIKILDEAGLGDGALMLGKMVDDVEQFQTGYEAIGKVKGLGPANDMAKTMTDQWERLEQGIFAIQAAIGSALLPALMPVVEMMSDGAQEIVTWTQLFPNITKHIGYAAMGLLGLVAVGGVITMLSGALSVAWATMALLAKSCWGLVSAITKATFSVLKFIFNALLKLIPATIKATWWLVKMSATGLWGLTKAVANATWALLRMTAVGLWGLTKAVASATWALLRMAVIGMWGLTKAIASATVALLNMAATGMVSFIGAMGRGTMAALKFTAALLTNPIFLIVAGVAAAVTAVGALIYYWDDLKASFGDTTWFQILEGALQIIALPFQKFFQLISAGWQWAMSGFTDTSGFQFLFDMADQMRNIFGSVFEWFHSMLSGIWDTVKGLVDWIPGLGGDEVENLTKIDVVQKARPSVQVQPGGAAKSIANYAGNQTHYGGIAIYPASMSSPQDLAEELEFAAG